VVVPSNAGFLSERPGSASIFAALQQFDGSAFRVAGDGGRVWTPAAERHRLVYEWIARPTNPESQYRFKVFEVVAGARIVGRAEPGEEVRAQLRFETRQGRRGLYHARTVVPEDGVYSLRVPFANGPADDLRGAAREIRTSRRYELLCRDEKASVFVSERAIMRGEVVTAPDLCTMPPSESLSN
jgi:hypothetical protein